ncbi:MAG TPA: ADP-ribosylation factor-like protein [Thermoanaerobaculia bacterium]|nr:ADP-ribosylation factor-like protein [Thermoanaerobaculia bacterium]
MNKATNEITLKLVYYGPGLCGKTTNLEKIYTNPKLDQKGKLLSMATETDRTLFFDFLPMELGTIGGQKVRVQLYTVPGQVFYDATRKLVLRGADGVVFVADSQASMRESNLQSLGNLHDNLRLNRIDPEKVALVFQYNKRDLASAMPVDEMSVYLRSGSAPVVEAVALQGVGVMQTLREGVNRIIENVRNHVDITLAGAPQLDAPDLTAGSGVVFASEGGPKVNVQGLSAGQPAATAEGTAAPWADVPLVEQPSVAPPEPAVFPFLRQGEQAASGPPSAGMFDPGEMPFDDPADDGALRAMHDSARAVVRALEEALQKAKDHEAGIIRRLRH